MAARPGPDQTGVSDAGMIIVTVRGPAPAQRCAEDHLGSVARERLVRMRAELIEKLDQDFDPGFLPLLANVQTAIAAIDAARDAATSGR